jgi:hypothetical protein
MEAWIFKDQTSYTQVVLAKVVLIFTPFYPFFVKECISQGA